MYYVCAIIFTIYNAIYDLRCLYVFMSSTAGPIFLFCEYIFMYLQNMTIKNTIQYNTINSIMPVLSLFADLVIWLLLHLHMYFIMFQFGTNKKTHFQQFVSTLVGY